MSRALLGTLALPAAAVAASAVAVDPWALLNSLGFPAAVAAFVLIRLEPRVERLTEAINALTIALAASGINARRGKEDKPRA